MGTYELPRNVKGEGRILFIFTTKSFIYTIVSALIGLPFYFIFSAFNMKMVGIIVVASIAIIGFIIGTFKMPELGRFEFTKKTGGENIDEIIKRAIKFKTRRKENICLQGGKKQ